MVGGGLRSFSWARGNGGAGLRLGVAWLAAVACSIVGPAPAGAAGGLDAAFGPSVSDPGWVVQPTPDPLPPTAYTGSWLQAVSCPSSSACTAVGLHVAGVVYDTVAEQWNGRHWALRPTIAPPNSELAAVSCTSASACIAVGNSAGGTLVERWDGLVWRIQQTPQTPGGPALYGVSCPSARFCIAVGAGSDGAGGLATAAERWDGSRWTVQPTPNPAGTSYAVLKSVSCTSAQACTAVGVYEGPHGQLLTLAERWDGSTWAIQPTPSLAGANDLKAVSCASQSACVAVGSVSTANQVTLVEAWDGTSWAIQPSPNPAGQRYASLSGVSCTSVSACTAVGHQNSPGVTPIGLAEHWDGTAWIMQPVPNPPGGVGGQLSGVSCTSASDCTAVGGGYYDGTGSRTLAERHS